MVRSELLEPGDILLSRSRGCQSALISYLTQDGGGSRYSHAAIVLYGRSWFESGDEDVAYAYKRIDKIERHGSDLWRLVDVSGFRNFGVYRHPDLAALAGTAGADLSRLIVSVTGNWLGKEYPSYGRLVEASRRLSRIRWIKHTLAVLLDKGFFWRDIIAPGPFCSELAYRMYGEMATRSGHAFNLLKVPREPGMTSPNDLANADISSLQHRPEIVVVENPDIADVRKSYLNAEIETLNEENTRFYNLIVQKSVRGTARVVKEETRLREIIDRILHPP